MAHIFYPEIKVLGNYLAVKVDMFAPSFLPSLHAPCFLAVSLSWPRDIFTLLIMVISSYRVVTLDSINRIIPLTIYIKIICMCV